MTGKKPLIHAEHLTFQYRAEPVLEDVSFTIDQGEFVGIIGPNGSGKTTLLKLLLGLLKPSTGKISILGKPVQLGKHADVVSYVPQKITQLETRFPITVEEIVALGRVPHHRLFERQSLHDQELITKALETVELLPFRKRLITELSGGQQQRAFIAKALAGEPQVLLLDEPTVGIDSNSQDKFYALLTQLHRDHGLTIVIVSHDIDVVMNEVDSLLCLNKHLIYHGNPKSFMKNEYLEKVYGKDRKFIIHGH